MPHLADRRPSNAYFEAGEGQRRKLASRKDWKRQRVGLGQSQRKLMQSWIMSDQQNIKDSFVDQGQALDQLVAVGEIKTIFDPAGWPPLRPSDHKLEGLASAHGARAQDEAYVADGTDQVLAHEPCRFPTALVQVSLVICDILLPARFRMAQQVQLMHWNSSRPGSIAGALLQVHDRPILPAIGSWW
jgi:hypothetical protein